jgi:glutamate synthase domain-containing protein 1
MSGEVAIRAMAVQHDRGNGLGGGFAGYGIYPEFPDHFAFHMMYHDLKAKEETDAYFDRYFLVDLAEPMPTRPVHGITDAPHLWRYFLTPDPHKLADAEMSAEDYVVHAVMTINSTIDGAFVASSGKNMGAFKGVGYPEAIGHYFRLEEYAGHTWTGHNRFPTNTPGWWGGAHPFALLDWTIVHNGEISSYGINSRYLEQFGYKCTLGTDTEVAAYLFDLMLRRHKLPLELACKALASPLWSDIDRMPGEGAAHVSSRGVRAWDAQRPLRHRARLQRRHGRPQRPHQAPPAGGGAQGQPARGRLRGERHPRHRARSRQHLGSEGRRAGHRAGRGDGLADPRRPAPVAVRDLMRCDRRRRDMRHRGGELRCRRPSYSPSSRSR